MWEFRRDPQALSPEEREKLQVLFTRLPLLEKLYRLRVRFKEIFDTAPTAKEAARWLCDLELQALDDGLDLTDFFVTYDTWQEGILAYFAAGKTSAAVEGINNKARVIVKRSYGLKSADSLWTRLYLDLNRAQDVVGYSIRQLREIVAGLKSLFSLSCT
jgi:transposase